MIDGLTDLVAEAQALSAADSQEGNLTTVQRLLWLGQKVAGDKPLYNMIHTYRFDAPIEVDRFARAFALVADGSDAMRSVFEEDSAGVPWQRERLGPAPPLESVDLSEELDGGLAFERWFSARSDRPFDLGEAVYDAALVRLSGDDFIWYLNIHHLVADSWAFGVIQRRVAHCYEALGRGQDPAVDVWPGFSAYREIERRLRRGDRAREARKYWAARCVEDQRPLVFYGATPVMNDFRTVRVSVPLDAQLSGEIRRLAAREDVRGLTEDLSLLGVFAALLQVFVHRVTGVSRFTVGMPFHNRLLPAHRETVGLLMEMGVLAAELGPDETFLDVVSGARAEIGGALAHLSPGCTDARSNASYQVLLNFLRSESAEMNGERPTLEWHHAGYGDAGHLLRLQVEDFNGTGLFQLHFDLDASVFGASARRWVVQQFRAVLEAFLADPGRAIGGFSLMSERDQERLVVKFNATARSGRGVPLVPTAVSAMCRAHPLETAVQSSSANNEQLTYGGLAGGVAALAAELGRRGVRRGDRVGILMDRCPQTVTACLAVWWAGAAYVPLDPSHPDRRLEAVIRDSSPSAMITREALSDRLSAADCPVLVLDSGMPLAAAVLPEHRCDPGDIAYLMYTSGSTGEPKGVMVSHGNLADYVDWAASQYCDGDRLTFPLYSSLAFDLTVTSLFVPLVTGGRVRVYPERGDRPGLEVLDVFQDDAVDVIKLTPAHLALALETDHTPSRPRRLIVGGEDFKRSLADRAWQRFSGRVELLNEYGPTEATVGCMIHRFDPIVDRAESVPIGSPAADAAIYLLDGAGQLAPPGVLGELCVSGPGIAQGYFRMPRRTAAVFDDDPRSPGSHLYRTGDIAAWDAAGGLRFLGRRDDQVKVRGARIELGEVEAQLLECPQLTDAAVRLVGDSDETRDTEVDQHCTRCGMDGRYPGLRFNENGVCNICRDYDTYRGRVEPYFKDLNAFRATLSGKSPSPEGYECMVLLSGGKDSTYALCRIVDMGFKVLAYTLDNGYLSEQAKTNIRRVTEHLGVDLEFGSTPHMNEIFADSLGRFSNVCNGCFKTLYTLSTGLADQKRIPFIVTGLARGQMFETRLSDMYDADVFDVDIIDSRILDARKAYHRMPDLIANRLDTRVFADDGVFERIEYVDFYRYCDATLDEMYAYLADRVPWVRPTDTGRSSNCLINDVGIYVHKRERGFHNYALPYSWDVRLGHKQRDAALDELDDEIDVRRVEAILDELDYKPRPRDDRHRASRLVAYYTAGQDPGGETLRRHCRERLPEFAVPSRFVRLDNLPLTANGKIDRRALPWPPPADERPIVELPPARGTEAELLAVWRSVFGDESIGPWDNFFELGGDSIISIQLVAGAAQAGLRISPADIFDQQTVAGVAALAERVAPESDDETPLVGPVPLSPIQCLYFDASPTEPAHWNQVMHLRMPADLDSESLRRALMAVLNRHDMLRARFQVHDGWQQSVAPPQASQAVFRDVDAASPFDDAVDELNRSFDLEAGCLLGALRFRDQGDEHRLVLSAHHLAVDGVSWWTVLKDLDTAYEAYASDRTPTFPRRTDSYLDWINDAREWTGTSAGREEAEWWLSTVGALTDPAAPLSPDVEAGTAGEAIRLVCTLDAKHTRHLLGDVHGAYNTRINDILLAALAATLGERAGRDQVLIALEGHGRERQGSALDLSRTVGWFTSLAPVVLPAGERHDQRALIGQTKEMLRRLPSGGAGFGMLRYLSGDDQLKARLAALPTPKILFNYLGQFERSLQAAKRFRPVGGGLSLSSGTDNPRLYALEINAMVVEDRLRVEWAFPVAAIPRQTVENLASEYIDCLGDLVDHCMDPRTGGATPSDFAQAALSQNELDDLMEDFGEDAF